MRDFVKAQDLSPDYLSDLGNIDAFKDQHGATYRYMRRSVKPVGLLAHPKIVLKAYHLLRENIPLDPGTAENFRGFLLSAIDSGEIDLKQGMGFAMLGQGFVSINVWGKGNGLFAHNFSRDAANASLIRRPLEETAIACTWDSRIINFECRLWHGYLKTRRGPEDKRRYLSTFIAGELEDPDVISVPEQYMREVKEGAAA
jgi:hypothetical protein